MTDANGRTIKRGDLVTVAGSYMGRNDGLYYVLRSDKALRIQRVTGSTQNEYGLPRADIRQTNGGDGTITIIGKAHAAG